MCICMPAMLLSVVSGRHAANQGIKIAPYPLTRIRGCLPFLLNCMLLVSQRWIAAIQALPSACFHRRSSQGRLQPFELRYRLLSAGVSPSIYSVPLDKYLVSFNFLSFLSHFILKKVSEKSHWVLRADR